MTAFEAGAPLRRQRRIRPSRVDRPNWKAECAETCLLRLERGKGCEALPIATWAGAIPPGYPAHEETYGNVTRLVPTQLIDVRMERALQVPITAGGVRIEPTTCLHCPVGGLLDRLHREIFGRPG